MSERYELAVQAELGPGPLGAGLAVASLGLAAVACLAMADPWRPACAVLLLAGGVALRRWLLRPGCRLEWRGWGDLWLTDGGGRRRRARLAAVQYACAAFVRLELLVEGRRERHVIWRVEQPDPTRRLLQRLRAGRWREPRPR